MTTIKETVDYKLVKDISGCTRICNKNTGCLSDWNCGSDARDEINHIKHLSVDEFDEYCEDVLG